MSPQPHQMMDPQIQIPNIQQIADMHLMNNQKQ